MGSTTSKPTGFKKIEIPNQGSITGLILSDVDRENGSEKAYRFTGIPYALPPVGERRWKKPEPLPSDFQYGANEKTYTEFGDICLQPTNYSPDVSPSPPKVTRAQSEDCLLLNIWVPASSPPPEGFPVFFYIHGGWLQVGDANHSPLKDPSDLISLKSQGGGGLNAIVVTPGYRLNVFGFLASKELAKESEDGSCGNYGFWDQRLALKWVSKHISHFNGNPDNITVGGLSAGAHSTHSQLLYEFTKSKEDPQFKRMIRRVFLQSNAVCLPSKTLDEVESLGQLRDLCRKVGIKEELNDEDKLKELRKIDGEKLVQLLPQMQFHTFRAVDDQSGNGGGFVRSDWIQSMKSGEFGKWCKENGIRIMIGETSDEQTLYRIINPPTGPDFESSLVEQVHNYYPSKVTEALLQCYPKSTASTSEAEDAANRLGRCCSDSQVHAAERCFIDWLTIPGGLTNSDIFRYRISFRSPILDKYAPKWMGVSHSFDDSLWWFAVRQRGELKDQENEEITKKFQDWVRPFVEFVKGKEVIELWYDGKGEERENGRLVRCMKEDGEIRVQRDEWRREREEVIRVIKDFLK